MKIGSFLTASQNSKQLSHRDDNGENQVWYNASHGFDNGEEESEGIWWDTKVEIVGETILFFFRVSLSKFSLEALFQSWVKRVFILEWRGMWNVRFFQNRGGSRLDLAAWLSREIQSRVSRMASCPVCPVVLQLAWLFIFQHAWHVCCFWRLAAASPPASPSRESLFSCTLLSKLHSISLTTLTTNPPKYRVTKCWITSKFGTE